MHDRQTYAELAVFDGAQPADWTPWTVPFERLDQRLAHYRPAPMAGLEHVYDSVQIRLLLAPSDRLRALKHEDPELLAPIAGAFVETSDAALADEHAQRVLANFRQLCIDITTARAVVKATTEVRFAIDDVGFTVFVVPGYHEHQVGKVWSQKLEAIARKALPSNLAYVECDTILRMPNVDVSNFYIEQCYDDMVAAKWRGIRDT